MNDNTIDARLRRLETGVKDLPTFQLSPNDRDYRVKSVSTIIATPTSIATNLTKVTLTWVGVEDPKVDHYEVWVSRITGSADKPYLAASVKDSPASFNIVSSAGHALAYVLTVMKNGVKTPLTAAPSVTFQVF